MWVYAGAHVPVSSATGSALGPRMIRPSTLVRKQTATKPKRADDEGQKDAGAERWGRQSTTVFTGFDLPIGLADREGVEAFDSKEAEASCGHL
ncbi:uncharacterized protein SPSK_02054 [Sporothrix schenckii 1099-18]|uniref:Uncharacterized protein n=1 Tax=Sporothrix schenckii 1099-18 TaxID=1397361 RepID=A0A0F2MD14_SPOSC|nr:uncharacterized protein SPSK_02054 [Sporothrix schenckii 1099-18]KJR86954.1 hypothetical protein SPSK_02054 [Sporothrix schenckii 1099-18]